MSRLTKRKKKSKPAKLKEADKLSKPPVRSKKGRKKVRPKSYVV